MIYLDLTNNQFSVFNFASNLGPLNSLQVLLLSNNLIQKLDADLQCTQLRRLELKHNKVKRFFVDQFFRMSIENLTIELAENTLESVDFRNLNTSNKTEGIARLFINLDEELACNCHSISLYNFLTRRLEMDSQIYEAIKVSPLDVKCKRADSKTPESVIKIDKASLSCPLNFPHQKLCPTSCVCDRRPYDGVLTIACQNIIIVPFLPPYRTLADIKLNKIELRINGNNIERLPSKHRDLNYNDVTEIYASHNNIRWIVIDNIPDHLELLDLKLNRLKRVPSDVIVRFETLKFLHLKDNPWNCSTSSELITFVKNHRKIVKDFNMIQCSNQQYFLEIDTNVKCKAPVLIAVISFVSLVSIAGLFFVFRHKREALIEWIFKNDKRNLLERIYERMKSYDAIIVAADYDIIFGKYITAKLMDKPNRFKIGFILKDWSSDHPIPPNVLKSFRNSRRVILILSEHFEENNWTRWNYFNTNTRIIFVSKGRPNNFDIDISNKVSIKFGDPWFWEKLKYAMQNRNELSVDEHVEVKT